MLGSSVAEKIGSQQTLLSCNIQFMYEYYRTEKQERLRLLPMQKN